MTETLTRPRMIVAEVTRHERKAVIASREHGVSLLALLSEIQRPPFAALSGMPLTDFELERIASARRIAKGPTT